MKFYFDEKLYHKRIWNHFIDFLIYLIFCLIYLIATDFEIKSFNGIPVLFIFIIIYFGYYFLTEYIFQKSLAKYITKTKVINKLGQKPILRQIALRCIIRIFENFVIGLLLIKYDDLDPRMLTYHDRWSGTRVIHDS